MPWSDVVSSDTHLRPISSVLSIRRKINAQNVSIYHSCDVFLIFILKQFITFVNLVSYGKMHLSRKVFREAPDSSFDC
ncbi:hypothetical protein PHAMO_270282 [Magnetospirillum molischianum DSM 120]|uniref:Uncharacterized protein n=1 Tax=Magnetospirillum molischianum DSM 120 TaxID=1150626 RepID=H8FSV3_MAGML|nr:hypothetical protein PHAMO_270282 [Magnetospirillum molischianum DSM 120]